MSTDVLRGWTSHHGGVTVLVRTAALAAGWAAYSLAAAELTDSTGGANIGVGLLAFGLLLASVGLGLRLMDRGARIHRWRSPGFRWLPSWGCWSPCSSH